MLLQEERGVCWIFIIPFVVLCWQARLELDHKRGLNDLQQQMRVLATPQMQVLFSQFHMICLDFNA